MAFARHAPPFERRAGVAICRAGGAVFHRVLAVVVRLRSLSRKVSDTDFQFSAKDQHQVGRNCADDISDPWLGGMKPMSWTTR
jgi:hypothetical protein